jgi:hypothetical protein
LPRNAQNIKDYEIPGLEEKPAINLFADDTVLYLSAEDRFDDILESARSRKLNVLKPDDQPIREDVHIAKRPDP